MELPCWIPHSNSIEGNLQFSRFFDRTNNAKSGAANFAAPSFALKGIMKDLIVSFKAKDTKVRNSTKA